MMAKYNYRKELETIHIGSTWYEVETKLKLEHTTQGKTLRRYMSDNPKDKRTPSVEMQKKIHHAYETMLFADLLANPLFSSDTKSLAESYNQRKRELAMFPVSGLPEILRRIYKEELSKNLSASIDAIIRFNHGKRSRFKMLGSWVTLDSGKATKRRLLVYFIFTVREMGTKEGAWKIFAHSTLKELKILKPKLHKDLKEVMDSL